MLSGGLCMLSTQQGSRGRLSRELVALWADEYRPALDLLDRTFPPGLIRYLKQRKPQLPSAQQPSTASPPPARLSVAVTSVNHSVPISRPGAVRPPCRVNSARCSCRARETLLELSQPISPAPRRACREASLRCKATRATS